MSHHHYEEIRQKYIDRYVAGDAAGLAKLFSEDCLMLPPDTPVAVGNAEVQALYEELFSQIAPSAMTIKPTEEVTVGDWGYGAGSWTVTAILKATEAPVNLEGKYLNVVKRQADGTWKIHRHAWNAPTQLAAMAAPRG